jgi:hypothetical protein
MLVCLALYAVYFSQVPRLRETQKYHSELRKGLRGVNNHTRIFTVTFVVPSALSEVMADYNNMAKILKQVCSIYGGHALQQVTNDN